MRTGRSQMVPSRQPAKPRPERCRADARANDVADTALQTDGTKWRGEVRPAAACARARRAGSL